MRDVWIRIRKIAYNGETSFEARVDLFPEAAVYEPTADEAYNGMRALLPDLVEHYIDVHGHVPWKILESQS